MPDQEKRCDVTVFGAGIIGICTALELLDRGLTVRVLDRLPPGQATSFGNAGVISPWSIVPQCTPGVWRKVPRWFLDPKGPVKLRWRDIGRVLPWALSFLGNATEAKVRSISGGMDTLMQGNISAYRRYLEGTDNGDLIVASDLVSIFRGRDKPDLGSLDMRLRAELGATLQLVDGHELREIEPEISPEYHSAIIVKNQSRCVSPSGLCGALALKAAARGAVFETTEVRDVRIAPDGGVTVVTESGNFTSEKLILCAGVWSARFVSGLGFKVPLMAERGYHLEFTDPGIRINNSVQDNAGKVIISSMSGGVRTAGTAEFAAVDAPPNYKRADVLAPLTKRVFPNLRAEPAKKWMGIRPSFPDNLPMIGRVPGLPGVIAAFGHSHYGLGMAPATARLAADIAIGRTPNVDMSPFQVDRF